MRYFFSNGLVNSVQIFTFKIILQIKEVSMQSLKKHIKSVMFHIISVHNKNFFLGCMGDTSGLRRNGRTVLKKC